MKIHCDYRIIMAVYEYVLKKEINHEKEETLKTLFKESISFSK